MMYAYVHTHFSLTRHRTHRYTLHHSLHRAPLPSSSPPSRFLFLLKSSHRLLYTTQRNTENLGKLIWIPNVVSANYCMLCVPPRAINIVRIGHFLTISASVSLTLSLSLRECLCVLMEMSFSAVCSWIGFPNQTRTKKEISHNGIYKHMNGMDKCIEIECSLFNINSIP